MITQPLSRVIGMSEHDQSLILPNDEYNQELVANVHPSDKKPWHVRGFLHLREPEKLTL